MLLSLTNHIWQYLGIALLLVVFQNHLFGQVEGGFINLTTRDGLPSNIVYEVIKDQQGYVWFATELGISRYNGEKFVNYSKKDGLPDNDILGLFEDSKGRIWFKTAMVIQPFVENSIWHGVSGLENGEVTIRFKHLHELLEISIKDNGKGFCESKITDKSKGIQLVKERFDMLKAYYNGDFSLEIFSQEHEVEGTNIVMKISNSLLQWLYT